jgi:NitT/TauT family transport system permease protein
MTTRRRLVELTLPALSIIGFVALWQIVVEWRGIPPIYLPAPSAIAVALAQMARDGSLWTNLAATILRIFAGFALPPSPGSRSAC